MLEEKAIRRRALRQGLEGAPSTIIFKASTKEAHTMAAMRQARFAIGDVVRHRLFPFRGVIYDVDPEFANSEEWWLSIPEKIRPGKDQPFYHLLAENEQSYYPAYVSEQNLLPDAHNGAIGHPKCAELFEGFDGERYVLKRSASGVN